MRGEQGGEGKFMNQNKEKTMKVGKRSVRSSSTRRASV